MTYPAQITNYAEQGLLKLLSQYQDSDRLKQLLETYLELIQNAENVTFEVLNAFNIETATGDLLLKFASWVGLDDLTGTDEAIRARIKAQIKVITSNAVADDFISIVQIIFPGAEPDISDSPPAQVVLDVHDITVGTGITGDDLFNILDNVPAAGVRFYLIFDVTSSATTFTFAPADVVVNDTSLGLADVGQTIGGHLAGVRST